MRSPHIAVEISVSNGECRYKVKSLHDHSSVRRLQKRSPIFHRTLCFHSGNQIPGDNRNVDGSADRADK